MQTFGDTKNAAHARRMTSIMQGKTKMGAMSQMIVQIDTDLVKQKEMAMKHPLEEGNLREIVRIDDRIDPAKLSRRGYVYCISLDLCGYKIVDDNYSVGRSSMRWEREGGIRFWELVRQSL